MASIGPKRLKIAAFLPENMQYLDAWRIGGLLQALERAAGLVFGAAPQLVLGAQIGAQARKGIFAPLLERAPSAALRFFEDYALGVSVAREMYPSRLRGPEDPETGVIPCDGGWNFSDCDLWVDFASTDGRPLFGVRPVISCVYAPEREDGSEAGQGFSAADRLRALRKSAVVAVCAPLDPVRVSERIGLSCAQVFRIGSPPPLVSAQPAPRREGGAGRLLALFGRSETRAIDAMRRLFLRSGAEGAIGVDVFGAHPGEIGALMRRFGAEEREAGGRCRIEFLDRERDVLRLMEGATHLAAGAGSAFGPYQDAYCEAFGLAPVKIAERGLLEHLPDLLPMEGALRYAPACDLAERLGRAARKPPAAVPRPPERAMEALAEDMAFMLRAAEHRLAGDAHV